MNLTVSYPGAVSQAARQPATDMRVQRASTQGTGEKGAASAEDASELPPEPTEEGEGCCAVCLMLSRIVNPFTAHACVISRVRSAHTDLQCKQCIFHFQYCVFFGWKSFHMLMKTEKQKDFKSGAFIGDFVGLSFLHFIKSEMFYSKHNFAKLFCYLRPMKRNLWIVF